LIESINFFCERFDLHERVYRRFPESHFPGMDVSRKDVYRKGAVTKWTSAHITVQMSDSAPCR